MNTVRRVYVYVAAAAGLAVLGTGAALLGQALVVALTSAGDQVLLAHLRRQVAEGGAAAVVGLPVWLAHWASARGAVRRDPSERTAILRHVYLYLVLAVTTVAAWLALEAALSALFRLLVAGSPGSPGSSVMQVALPLPLLAVSLVLWAAHRRVLAAGRAAGGERDAAATLRRWYRYGLGLVTFAALLSGAARVVGFTWELLVTPVIAPVTGGAAAVAASAAGTVAALAAWLALWSGWAVAPAPHRKELAAQDAGSTLRPVYLFLTLALSVTLTLLAAWQIVFVTMARALGVERPGGTGGSLLFALAGPAGTLLAGGVGWLYQRRALALQARTQAELPRQAGVRRLYTYVISLAALAMLAAGASGLLWTVADLATNAPYPPDAGLWWRDRVSVYTALAVVALPVWLLHWGPVASPRQTPAEAASLARRIYVYVTLLAGVLALLGAGVAGAKQVLDLALGEAATSSAVTTLARAAAVATVAAFVAVYHRQVAHADDVETATPLAPRGLPAAA